MSAVRGVVTTTWSRSWRISAASSTGGRPAARSPTTAAGSGSENENVLPLPSSLSTQTRPPWCSTISRQIGRPSPVPFGLSVSVSPTCLKRSKTLGWSAGAMPMPVSTTLTTSSPPRRDGAAGDRAGVGELHRVGDQVDDDLDQAIAIAGDRRQVGRDVLDEPQALLLEQRGRGGRGVIDDVGHRTGSMCHSSLPASIFARSSTSSISLVRRSPSLTTTFRLSSTCCIVWRDLAVVGRHQREDAIVEPLLDDLGEAEHRGQRRAQLVADGGEERALGGVGFFGDGARPLAPPRTGGGSRAPARSSAGRRRRCRARWRCRTPGSASR